MEGEGVIVWPSGEHYQGTFFTFIFIFSEIDYTEKENIFGQMEKYLRDLLLMENEMELAR